MIRLFNDNIRIGFCDNWGDKRFGFSLDNGMFEYDQFNIWNLYICYPNKEFRKWW